MTGQSGNNKRYRKNETHEYYKTQRYAICQKTEAGTQRVIGIVKWLCLASIGGFAWLSIRELSGQVTFANIDLNFLANLTFDRYVSWACAGGFGLAYFTTKRNSGRRIEQLSEKNDKLERLLDPNRSSSNLRTNGTHHTE